MKNFRLLNADEIDCRIAQVKDNGLSLLLYKDARCDMNILDETVGMMNWKKEYSRDNRNCTVSIWDEEKKQWISKEDTGTESNTEQEKGLASDSFKRACFNWGIGRELYSAPFIWIPQGSCAIQNKKCYDRFKVTEIGYDDSERINKLTIVNTKTRAVVYELKPAKTITKVMQTSLAKVTKEHGYTEAEICGHFGVSKYSELTVDQFKKLMSSMGEKS